jgi:hypothetical protein
VGISKKSRKMKNDNLMISYQMGKVASSSITESIRGCAQIHSWDGEEPIKYFSSRYTGSLKGRVLQYFQWKRASHNLKKKLDENESVKLLIGVREPIGRNISGYFQTLTEREDGKTVDEQINMFFAFCPHLASSYWFENELQKSFNINVYEYPFDKKRGFETFQQGKVEVLIYQFEKLRTLEYEIGNFLSDKNFKLSQVNSAEDKWLNTLYKEFKNKINFPEHYIDLLYDSKFSKHFYSQNELEAFKNMWLHKQ